ncbi:hypothetical protein BpHYR1_051672, partial [Brachionus plicatilis]
GRELENRLNDRECSSDADCFYSDECTATCDLNSHKCTHQLNSLQIRVFCEFFQRFIDSHSELKAEFDPVIKRCLKLKPFYLSKEDNFEQNIIPFELDEQKRAYWNASMEYTLTAKSLNDKIWQKIKLVNDPVKPKKTTRKPSAGSNKFSLIFIRDCIIMRPSVFIFILKNYTLNDFISLYIIFFVAEFSKYHTCTKVRKKVISKTLKFIIYFQKRYVEIESQKNTNRARSLDEQTVFDGDFLQVSV